MCEFTLEQIIGDNIKALIEGFLCITSISNDPVLIQGERGTGKDLLARAIHFTSKRSGKPFWVIDCTRLPEHLIESELFGCEEGAYTDAVKKLGRVEMAKGGTLFIDEITSLPLTSQSKLLRFIEYGEFEHLGGKSIEKADVRIIASTNVKIKEKVLQGEFRYDLYDRISVIDFILPPLRSRGEDIFQLTDHFIKQNCKEFGVNEEMIRIDDNFINILRTYNWPGNVRELKNRIRRITLELVSKRKDNDFVHFTESIAQRLIQMSNNDRYFYEPRKIYDSDSLLSEIKKYLESSSLQKISNEDLRNIIENKFNYSNLNRDNMYHRFIKVLVKNGILEKVGSFGRGVYYRIKKKSI